METYNSLAHFDLVSQEQFRAAQLTAPERRA
jgi:hypothetical protein